MPSVKRRFKNLAKSGLFNLHKAMLRVGLIVLPNHYYAPIADVNRLAATRARWAVRAPMHGIDTEPGRQLEWLRRNVLPFEPEYRGNQRYLDGVAAGYGPGYGYIEAQCLHGVVRSLKPRRIIEVGSGVSTHVMLGALERNASDGQAGKLTCIEPYPSDFLRNASGIDLIGHPVEELDPAVFDALEAGDMLFINSTHAVRPGGDVVYLYLQIVLRLKPGVLVHVHDIYFPFLHQRDLLHTLFQWQESALLAALLTGNAGLRIESCLSQLHYDDPPGLLSIFPEYLRNPGEDGLSEAASQGHFPSSVYLLTG